MRISATAEYACAAMLDLAGASGPRPVKVQAISEGTGIPAGFLVQILLDLKKAGLVGSVRGAAGGYHLARSAEKITLADIILAIMDRTLTQRSELTKLKQSPVVTVLLDVWNQVAAEELKVLQAHTLADLLRKTRDSALTYSI